MRQQRRYDCVVYLFPQCADIRDQEKPKEKTIFTVKLEKIDAANKAKVIKEVKALNPTMSLIDVRSIVPCLDAES